MSDSPKKIGKELWKFVSMEPGELYVMITGITMMPRWFANSLDFLHMVRVSKFCSSTNIPEM